MSGLVKGQLGNILHYIYVIFIFGGGLNLYLGILSLSFWRN